MAASKRQARSIPRYVTLAEVHRILELAEHDRDRWLIRLLWTTGARISEVLAARVGDITRHGIRLPNLKRGGGVAEEKHVILPPAFLAELRAYVRGKPLSAPIISRLDDETKPIRRCQAWGIVTRLSAAAGVSKRHATGDASAAWAHCFRHGYAVHLLENQVPITTVMEQLGHRNLASTQQYTRIVDPRKEELLSKITF